MLSKKATKSKVGSKSFTLTKKGCHSTQCLFFYIFIFLHIKFFCSDNTKARNSKCYKKLHLSRCNGGLSTDIASIFMQGETAFNRNCYISVSCLK